VIDGICPIEGDQVPSPPFQVRVVYTVEGIEDSLIVNILPSDYLGENLTTEIDLVELSNYNVSDNIIILTVEDSYEGIPPTGQILTYQASVVPATFTDETRVYSTEIFGIQFSGIEIPVAAETGEDKIVGYFIVRNERTETEKTILDSAVVVPSVTNDKYISHGLLFPEFEIGDRRISDRVYGLITPEHKFNDKKYSEFTEMKQEGQFKITDRLKSKSRYLDVSDGTSYDSSVHKSGGGKDDDG